MGRIRIAYFVGIISVGALVWLIGSSRLTAPPYPDHLTAPDLPSPPNLSSVSSNSHSVTQQDLILQSPVTSPIIETAMTIREHRSQPDSSGRIVRSRLVEAEFKYPLLLVHETVTLHNATRAEVLQGREVMVADHIIVRLRPHALMADLKILNEKYGARILRKLYLPDTYLVQFAMPGLDTIKKAITDYTSEAEVIAYAEPDYILHTTQIYPNDPEFPQLYGLHNTGQSGGIPNADIDAPEAWSMTTGLPSVIIAVIDTGVDYTHPDLAENIWINPGEIAGDGIDNDNNGFVDDLHGWDFYGDDSDPMDDNSHGTHVAGTIAAVGNNATGVVGVCWSSTILALKFLGAGGSGSHSDAVDALMYAAILKRNGAADIRLTSNSWGGGGPSQSLEDAIAANDELSIFFVAAAGNDASDNDVQPHHPSSFTNDNVISVASTDRHDSRSPFSNYGAASVDLGAPGSAILSTIPGGGFGTKSGTSMATPHVAGVLALMYAIAPGASMQEIKEALFLGVDPLPSLVGKCVTGGRLNARKAIINLGMRVRSSEPSSGAVVTFPPTNVVITFTYPYDPASIDVTDCLLNGVPSESVAQENPTTLRFHFNEFVVSNQGIQIITVPDGSVLQDGTAQSNPLFSAHFLYDEIPMAVIASEPASGSIIELPLWQLILHLNEEVDSTSVDISDLAISQGSVTGAVALDADSVMYSFGGVQNEGVLSIKLHKGALKDTFGNPSLAYDVTFHADFGTTAFPVPLTTMIPAGAQAFTGAKSAIITESDHDDFTINLPAGNKVTLLVEPSNFLQPVVSILDVNQEQLSSHAASSAGSFAIVSSIPITSNGVHTIRVSGENNSQGAYTLNVYLNADIETEILDFDSNDDADSAQSIDDAMVAVGSAFQQRAVVFGKIFSSIITNVIAEDFENDWPGERWTTYSSTESGRIAISSNGSTITGSRYLLLDNSNPAVTNLNEAIWRVNLSGLNQAQLMFQHAQWQEELNIWTTPRHHGHRNADAVAISDKGGAWHQVWAPTFRQPPGTWHPYSVDLLTNAYAARMNTDAEFLIKFQQWDNDAPPHDGMGFDDLQILAPVPTEDWFQFTAQPGDRIGVRLTPHIPSWMTLSLYGVSNQVVRQSSSSGDLRETILDDYLIQEAGTYRLRISAGGNFSYTLSVTKNTTFAHEKYGDIEYQDITRTGHVIGDLSNDGTLYAYEAPGSTLGSILKLDPVTLNVRNLFSAPHHPGAVYGAFFGELSFDGTWLWFTAGKDEQGFQRIFKIDPSSGDSVDTFDVNLPTVITGLGNLDGELFVGSQQHTIEVYNESTLSWSRNLPDNLPGWLTGLEGSSWSGNMFATAKADTLYRLNPASGAVMAQNLMNPRPDGVEISLGLAGAEAFIGNWGGDDDVLVLSANTLNLLRKLNWQGEPLAGLAGIQSGSPLDEFLINVVVGDELTIQTYTPGSFTTNFALPINTLDPRIELIDPGLSIVAMDDNSAGDGINALLAHTALTGGIYKVRISSASSFGNYALSVQGASGQPLNTQLVLIIPEDIIIECGSSDVPEVTGQASADTDCVSTVAVSHSDEYVSGSCGDNSTIYRTWIAQDECGNSTSMIQVITRIDTLPPEILLPAPATTSWGNNIHPIVLGYATATDACSSEVTMDYVDDISGNITNHTLILNRSWFAEDACGNITYRIDEILITNALPPIMESEPATTLGMDNSVQWSDRVPAHLYVYQMAATVWFNTILETGITTQRLHTFQELADGITYFFRSKSVLTGDTVTLETDWATPVQSLQLSFDGDHDQDGVDNYTESLSNTDPRDRDSVFEVLHVSETSGNIRVEWKGGTNIVQILEVQHSINDDFWEDVYTNSSVMTTNEALIYPDPSSSAIYRLRVIPTKP